MKRDEQRTNTETQEVLRDRQEVSRQRNFTVKAW